MPYRLNVLATIVSQGFARLYSERFGISIPEWRVIAMLGQHRALTSKGIGERTHMHKTMVSRAVTDLERHGLLSRLRIATTSGRRSCRSPNGTAHLRRNRAAGARLRGSADRRPVRCRPGGVRPDRGDAAGPVGDRFRARCQGRRRRLNRAAARLRQAWNEPDRICRQSDTDEVRYDLAAMRRASAVLPARPRPALATTRVSSACCRAFSFTGTFLAKFCALRLQFALAPAGAPEEYA